MHHLMGHRILQMPAIPHFVCTHQYPIVRVEPSRLSIRTSSTVNVMARDISAQLTDVVAQEADNGACERRINQSINPWQVGTNDTHFRSRNYAKTYYIEVDNLSVRRSACNPRPRSGYLALCETAPCLHRTSSRSRSRIYSAIVSMCRLQE